jgi:catechol 2,3-dioxygenase-like lactoylglutathione lyase family enzyme
MEPLMDSEFEGDWPTLFSTDTNKLRSIFLGSPEDPSGGVVELVVFNPPGTATRQPSPSERQPSAGGFFLLSVYGDVPAMLGRLADLGVKPESEIEVASPSGPVAMATVRDPDGVLVELVHTT